jgi:hypothetical protein
MEKWLRPSEKGSGGGVGKVEWHFIVMCALKCHRRDLRGFRRELGKWTNDMFNGRRYFYYLDFALRSVIVRRLDHNISVTRIEELANILWPDWSRLVSFSRATFSDMLLTASNMLDPSDEVTDQRTSYASLAALGLLLNHPGRELRNVRKDLASHLRENSVEIHQLGIEI